MYRNTFVGFPTNICPAKVKLETIQKGTFSNSKGRFSENSDFKAMSPEYHAISTSKHFYV